MALWDVTPKEVKGPDKATAYTTAKTHLAVTKKPTPVVEPPPVVVEPPPIPPPPDPAVPSFLTGKSPIWEKACTYPDPFAAQKFRTAEMENRNHTQNATIWGEGPTSMANIEPGRFRQFASGGPHDHPYFRFYAPAGDHVWTQGGVAGRCALGYPSIEPRTGLPAHPGPPGSIFRYEGQTTVDLATIRLVSPWNVNASNWRVLIQWKQNEWADPRGLSPTLALHQRGGYWCLCQEPQGQWIDRNGQGDVIWKHPAVAGNWVAFAFQITWSVDPAKGKVQAFVDADLDGVYEVKSPVLTYNTLLSYPGRTPGIEAMTSWGVYEGTAGDTADFADLSIYA